MIFYKRVPYHTNTSYPWDHSRADAIDKHDEYLDIAVGSGQGYPRGVLTHPSRVTGWVYPPLTHPKTLQGWYRVSIILLLFFRLKSTCSLRLWCFTHHATSSFGTSIMVGF